MIHLRRHMVLIDKADGTCPQRVDAIAPTVIETVPFTKCTPRTGHILAFLGEEPVSSSATLRLFATSNSPSLQQMAPVSCHPIFGQDLGGIKLGIQKRIGRNVTEIFC